MPIYAFMCAGCGPFDLLRPMAQVGAPARCPGCGGDARRIFTPPGLPVLARPVRGALDMEEKSAHEPAVVTEKRGRPLAHRHAPGPPWTLGH